MTAVDRRIGRKIPQFVRREDSPGLRLDSGPYVGKIKNNLDTIRAGRLEVWIPDLGGDENDPYAWRIVNYASPFFGSSSQTEDNDKNDFKSVRHTYGMWFTPPDVDNFVICTFIAGDPMRGFWFACVPSQLGQHMVPAIAGSVKVDNGNINDSAVSEIYESGNPYPVVEFNENGADENKLSNFVNQKKPLHEYQVKILGEQGLDKDKIRGVITSSATRESPSAVFGISTPGRELSSSSSKIDEKKPSQALEVYGRQGGHTFVMDDGDYQGENQLMRFRTAAGHQIMMNDTEEIIYISNATGKVWVELTGTGNLHVYSEESVSFRAKKGFNFYTEKDFIVDAEGDIKFRSKKALRVETDETDLVSNKKTTIYSGDVDIGTQGKINLRAKGASSFTVDGELILAGSTIKLNSGKGPDVKKPEKIKDENFNDAEQQGKKWKSQSNKIKSITKIIPTHEPWPRPVKEKSQAPALGGGGEAGGGEAEAATGTAAPGETTTRKSVSGGGTTTATGTPNLTSKVSTPSAIGTNIASGEGVKKPVDPSYLNRSDNPTPSSGVGNLSPDQVKALKTQIAYSESSFNYNSVNQYDYLGKYQMGSAALTDLGYIKPDAYAKYGQSAVNYPSSWTGKEGISSKDSFLNNSSAQEQAMENLLARNYKTLTRIGAVSNNDDQSTVAGMLATSHLLGAGAAKKWRETGVGADANNTTGTTYFNQGRYAIDVLSRA